MARIVGLLLLLGCSVAIARPDESTALSDCNRMFELGFAGDFDHAIPYFYEPVVRMIGKEKLPQVLKNFFHAMPEVQFTKMVCLAPIQRGEANGLKFLLFPVATHATTPKGSMVSHSWMLGVSKDGADYTFVSAKSNESMRPLFPSGLGSISIPPQPPAEFGSTVAPSGPAPAAITPSAAPAGAQLQVDVGGVAVALPAPVGFVSTSDADVRRVFSSLLRHGSRLGAAFITTGDADNLKAGRAGTFEQYSAVLIPNGADTHWMTVADFGAFKNTLKDKFPAVMPEAAKIASEELSEKKGISVTGIEAPVIFHEDTRSLGWTMPATYDSSEGKFGENLTVLFATVRDRLIVLQIVSGPSAADRESAEKTAREWAASAVDLNPQK